MHATVPSLLTNTPSGEAPIRGRSGGRIRGGGGERRGGKRLDKEEEEEEEEDEDEEDESRASNRQIPI